MQLTRLFTSVDPLADHPNQVGLTPYKYTWNNPTTLTDPDRRCPWCVGFAVGVALDYATQVGVNLYQGKDLGDALTDVDGTSLFVSGAAGAFGVGVAQKASQFGKLARVGTELASDATVSVASQAINEGEVDLTTVATDVAIGQVA